MTKVLLLLALLTTWAHAHDCPSTGRMGFYAGSFDPPTRGHTAIIREAIRQMGTVCIMVNTLGPKDYNATYEQRVRMIRAALGPDAERLNFTRSPAGNSTEMIESLSRTSSELHVFRGSDIDKAPVNHPNVSYTIFDREGQVNANWQGPRVRVVPDLETGMSSTELRAAIIRNDTERVSRMLDPSVQQIIAEDRLYRPASNQAQALRDYRAAFDAYRAANPRAQRSDFTLPAFKDTQSPQEWNAKFGRELSGLTAPMPINECFNAVLRMHLP